MNSWPKKKKKNNLKIAIRNCRGLVREGQKNVTPQDKSQAKCYVEKFQKLLKRFEQNIP